MSIKEVNSRFWNGPVKVMLGAIAVSVVGWIGFASLHEEPDRSSSPENQNVQNGVELLPAEAELSRFHY